MTRRALPLSVPVAVLLTAVLAGAAAVFFVLDVRQRARTDRGPKFHRTDLTVYLAAADALDRGDDPYDATSPRGWRYVYPPLLAVVAQPLARLDVKDAALVVYVASVLSLAFAARATSRSLGTRGPLAVGLALLAASPFLVQALQRGQVTVVLLALQVGALAALVAGRGVLAGLLLAVGVGLRLTPALPAGMVGLACLVRIVRGDRAAWRFPLGLLAGLVAVFVAVPVLALGPARAEAVTRRWLEVGRDVYAARPGELADLGADYRINEWSFKNQGVRRVVGSTVARVEGLPVAADGRPALGDRERVVDLAATGAAVLALAAAVALALRRMKDPTSAPYRSAYVLGLALPAFATRYGFPVHYPVLVPLLAEVAQALPARRARLAAAAFAVALLAFYGAHAVPWLRPAAEHGVLLLGILALVLLAPRPPRAEVGGSS